MDNQTILPSIKHKLVLLGDQSVGKTSIITRFMYDTFENQYQATIGIDFFSKTIPLPTHLVRLHLWDTAGQERFHSLIPSYIRNSAATIIVYDVNSRPSFIHTFKWIEEVRAERGDDVVIMLCGNKTDMSVESRQVSTTEAKSKADEYKVQFIEVSAKTGSNIRALFRQIAESLPSPLIRGEDDDANKTQANNNNSNNNSSNNNKNRDKVRRGDTSENRPITLNRSDPLLVTPSVQASHNVLTEQSHNSTNNTSQSNKQGCCS